MVLKQRPIRVLLDVMEPLGVLPASVAAEVGSSARGAPLPLLPPEAAVAHLVEKRWRGVADEGLRGVEELAGGDWAGGEDTAAGRLRPVHADRRRAAGGGRRGGEEAAAEQHEPCREEDATMRGVAKRSRPLV